MAVGTIITRFYPKVPEIWILRANGYEYIEIPLRVSPHTLLESVWQAASSWVVGFIVGERISIVVFPWVCGFAMADLREQRVCIKFCFKLGKTAAKTHQMLKQAFGDNSLGQKQTYDWYKRFKNGRTSTDDDRSGRPSTGITPENVTKVRDLILQDRRLTIQDLCNTLGLSYGTCQRILSEELNMRRIVAKFVPWLLQNEQKQHHLEVCRELQQQLQEDPNFLSKVVTGDESWVYGYDPETKQQSSKRKSPSSPRIKKFWQFKSNIKSMLICFFDKDGIVHKEFVPPGQTVSKEFYRDVLRRLREDMRRKRPEKWRTNDRIRLTLCRNFWLKTRWQLFPSHRTRQT